MNESDPFELLSSLRPDDANDFLAPGDDPAADAMLEHIMASDPKVRRHRRRRRVLVGAAVGLVLGSGAVAAALLLDRPSDPATLACYSEASTDPAVQVGLTMDPASTPLDQCHELWLDGTLGTGEPPPLTACVTVEGIVAVLPGDEGTCTGLGLAALDPSANLDQSGAARVASAISEDYPSECVDSLEAATLIVEGILTEVDAGRWEVQVAGEITLERPCVFAAVDAHNQVVLLVAAAGAPG